MAGSFDPYLHWLGIRDPERPPNHYRLLGVAMFEDDPEVLSNAADRQMAHVRTFQTGKRSSESQKLLNELATAKICLLNPGKKAEYDIELRTQQARQAVVPPPVAPPPVESPFDPLEDLTSDAPQVGVVLETPVFESMSPLRPTLSKTAARSWSNSSPTLFIIAFLSVLLLLGLAFVWFGTKPPVEKVTDEAAAARSPVVPSTTKPSPQAPMKPQAKATAKPPSKPHPKPKPKTSPKPKTEVLPPASESLRLARRRMRLRNMSGASHYLRRARKTALPSENEEVDRLQTILKHQEAYWTAVRRALRGLKPGETLTLDDRELTILEIEQDEVLLVDGDVRTRYTLGSLPLKIVMEIAERELPESSEVAILGKAAVLLFDPEGRHDRVRELCERAISQGLSARELLDEMDGKPARETDMPGPKLPGAKPGRSGKDSRWEVPGAAALDKALNEIHEVFKDRYTGAKHRNEKQDLGRMLFQQAQETHDDPTSRYMLYSEARDVAVASGSAHLFRRVVEAMGREYQLDGRATAVAVLVESARKPRDVASNRSLGRLALEMADSAMRRGEYDSAAQLAGAAKEVARKARDGDTVKQSVALAKDVDERKRVKAGFAAAKKSLTRNPDDTEANMAVAKYRCLVKNDWSRGLPLILKGADEAMKIPARSEATNPPRSAADMAALGDRWREAAEAADPTHQQFARTRAIYWYRRALPNLSGSTRKKVERHLDRILQLQ